MPKPSVILATYLTDSRRVMKASLGLEIGGDAKRQAEDFFELRRAFGVEGYMSSGDAFTAIDKALMAEALENVEEDKPRG